METNQAEAGPSSKANSVAQEEKQMEPLTSMAIPPSVSFQHPETAK